MKKKLTVFLTGAAGGMGWIKRASAFRKEQTEA